MRSRSATEVPPNFITRSGIPCPQHRQFQGRVLWRAMKRTRGRQGFHCIYRQFGFEVRQPFTGAAPLARLKAHGKTARGRCRRRSKAGDSRWFQWVAQAIAAGRQSQGTVDAALFRGLLAVVIILIAVVVIGRLMFPLPGHLAAPGRGRHSDQPDTRLGQFALTAAQQHPDLSGRDAAAQWS